MAAVPVTDPDMIARLNAARQGPRPLMNVPVAPPANFAPQGRSPGPLTPIGTADPNYIRTVKGIETGISTAGQIEAARAGAAATGANQIAAQREKARLDAEAAERARRSNVNTLTPEMAGDLKSRLAAMGELQKRLNEMKGMYNRNLKGAPASRGFGLTEMLPEFMSPDNQDFNQKGRRMGPIITSVLGLGSKNTDAASEYQQKVVPFIPQASSFDGTNEDKFRDLQSMIDTQRALVSKQLGLPVPTQKRPRAANPKAQQKVVHFNDLPE